MPGPMTRGIQPRRPVTHPGSRSGSRMIWIVLIAITLPTIFFTWLRMARSNRLAKNEAYRLEQRRQRDAQDLAQWNMALIRRDRRRQENLDSAKIPGFVPKPDCATCEGIGLGKIPGNDPNSRPLLFPCLECRGKGFK